MVNYKDIINFIKTKLPSSKITYLYKGKEPGSNIDRYIINTNVNNKKISFRIGQNIVFYLEESPRNILKHQPLLSSKQVQNFVNDCINNIEIYLERISLPDVQSYARKYLGKEESTKKDKNALSFYYDKFFIVVTPELILLALKSTKRTIRAIELKKGTLDNIFSELKYYAEGIRKDKIK